MDARLSRHWKMPGVLPASFCVLWLVLLAAVSPLDRTYFTDRAPVVTRTPEGGMQFNFRSSEPDLILAERPFGGHYPEPVNMPLRVGLGVVGLLSLPAAVSAMLTSHVLEPSVGLLRASWVGTAVFFAIGSMQWWVIGAIISAFRHRRVPATQPARSHHP